MEEDVNPNNKMIAAPKEINLISILGFFLSLGIIALGQPARMGWLGALAAAAGFTLFFCTLPSKADSVKKIFHRSSMVCCDSTGPAVLDDID